MYYSILQYTALHCTALHCIILHYSTVQCTTVHCTVLPCRCSSSCCIQRVLAVKTLYSQLSRTQDNLFQQTVLSSYVFSTLYSTQYSEYYFTQEAGTLPLTLPYLPFIPNFFVSFSHLTPPFTLTILILPSFHFRCTFLSNFALTLTQLCWTQSFTKTFPAQAMPPYYAPWPRVMQYNTSRPISFHLSMSHHLTSCLVWHHVTSCHIMSHKNVLGHMPWITLDHSCICSHGSSNTFFVLFNLM